MKLERQISLALLTAVISTLVSAQQSVNAQQLAFPTAKGAGAYITGGRGGQILKVTNLNPTGPGSFLQALRTEGPRVIVFEVGGTIDLRSETGFYVSLIEGEEFDDLTIAGQTAPGGITLETESFFFENVDNVVVRYLRNKHVAIKPAKQEDGANMNGTDLMFDHCSIIGGKDEIVCLCNTVGNVDNVSFQHNLVANGKTGMIIGGAFAGYPDITQAGTSGDLNHQASVIGNLFTETSHRFPNPSASGGGSYDVINNVVYNARFRYNSIGASTIERYGELNRYMHINYNFIGNYFKTSTHFLNEYGADYARKNPNKIQEWNNEASIEPDNVQIYSANNFSVGVTEYPQENDWSFWKNFSYSGDEGQHPNWEYDELKTNDWFSTTPLPLLGQSFEVTSPQMALDTVIADVGANAYLDNDHEKVYYTEALDEFYLTGFEQDTTTRFGGWDESEMIYGNHTGFTRPANWDTDNDGMPDTWEASTFGDLSQSSWADYDSNGVPNIEEYLNLIDDLSNDVSVVGTNIDPQSIMLSETGYVYPNEILPPNASDQTGVWSSSYESIAQIDQLSGLVTPLSAGQTDITFTTSDGAYSDTATLTVVADTDSGPDKTTLISPSGVSDTSAPQYRWNAIGNASWYWLYVSDDSGTPINKWYSAVDANCETGTGVCSVTPSIPVSGAARWWVRTWNNIDIGPWSESLAFSFVASAPGQAALISPNGTVGISTPTYTWNAVPNSSWYYLWVNDTSGTPVGTWYTAAESGCENASDVCTVTPTTAIQGNATWWIKTWNTIGPGPWSAAMRFQ